MNKKKKDPPWKEPEDPVGDVEIPEHDPEKRRDPEQDKKKRRLPPDPDQKQEPVKEPDPRRRNNP